MRRRLFNIASVLLLLLFVATVALWVPRQWLPIVVAIGCIAAFVTGRWIIFRRAMRSPNNGNEFSVDLLRFSGRSWWWSGGGFASHLPPPGKVVLAVVAIIVFVSVLLFPAFAELFAFVSAAGFCIWLPLYFWRLFHSQRRLERLTRTRRQLGLCECCGYDLRASTDRCPECGTAVPLRQETSA